GDLVVVTELEHHSNFVPWQYMAKRTGAELRMIELDEHGELDLSSLDAIAAEGNVKVVANNLVSNALGTINPIEKLSAWAPEQGAIMAVDGAEAAPHKAGGVQALGWGSGGSEQVGRRQGAGLRLIRVLRAQDVRPDERRRALGPPRAARVDG